MIRTICIFTFLVFMTSCFLPDIPDYSRHEVSRVASPSGRIEALLFEVQRTRDRDFEYEVFLVPAGDKSADNRVEVATLDGAYRSERADGGVLANGANLKWDGAEKLIVEYFKVRGETSSKNIVTVVGEQVQVLLRSGVKDPNASAGRMWHGKNEDSLEP